MPATGPGPRTSQGPGRSRRTRVEREDVTAAIRWDRVSRYGLLAVFAAVLFLYIGPARSFVNTLRESHRRHAEVQGLARQNRELRAQQRALRDPRTLEAMARQLGMVRPGERPYVISGLPRGGR